MIHQYCFVKCPVLVFHSFRLHVRYASLLNLKDLSKLSHKNLVLPGNEELDTEYCHDRISKGKSACRKLQTTFPRLQSHEILENLLDILAPKRDGLKMPLW